MNTKCNFKKNYNFIIVFFSLCVIIKIGDGMKKNKGFTLIELIGVIVIIALLALLITPIVSTIIKKSKTEVYEKTLKNIELAAKNWASDEDNALNLPNTNNNCYVVTLGELKQSGYIDLDVKDARNGKKLDNNKTLVLITKMANGNGYDYEVIEDGNVGRTCTTEKVDPKAPVISATTSDNFLKSFNLEISYISDFGLASNNSYQYYLSSSATKLVGGSWINYTNGVSQNIGSGLNGSYYVFVKRIKNTDNIQSTLGGVIVNTDGGSYQRFGPYKFDNKLPQWKFYSKTNTNTFAQNEYQKSVYAYSDDTVTITIRGTDENYLSNTLNLNNIKILIGGVDVTNSVTKTLSSAKNINNGVEYTLTIKNMTQKGTLSLQIPAGTLTDKASNTNSSTTINTGIKVNTCIFADGTTWSASEFPAKQRTEFTLYCDGIYEISLSGAQGGGSRGGKGATVTARVNLKRRNKLYVTVGGQNGYNGGGSGDANGGGATDIRIDGTGLENRIMIAAGGGGGGGDYSGGAGGTDVGGTGGIDGVASCTYCSTNEGDNARHSSCGFCGDLSTVSGCYARLSQGGTQTSGGAYAMTIHCNAFVGAWGGTSGKLGIGGNGQISGGGGGGFYGGGGGSATPFKLMGGAGGSSCVSDGTSRCTNSKYIFTNKSWTAGQKAGDGSATIKLIQAS